MELIWSAYTAKIYPSKGENEVLVGNVSWGRGLERELSISENFLIVVLQLSVRLQYEFGL